MKIPVSVFVISVVLVALLAAGVSWAAAQGDDLIQACVNGRGRIRIVESAEECRPNETFLDWPGSSSSGVGLEIMGFYVVSLPLPDEEIPTIISCEPGDIATGGGFAHADENSVLELAAFRPEPSTGTPTGWYFMPQGIDQIGYVTCADITP